MFLEHKNYFFYIQFKLNDFFVLSVVKCISHIMYCIKFYVAWFIETVIRLEHLRRKINIEFL